MEKPSRYKAKDIHGDWVVGWYVELHMARTDKHDNVIGFDVIPSIYNDEPGCRKGCHWHTIKADTLQRVSEPITINFDRYGQEQ